MTSALSTSARKTRVPEGLHDKMKPWPWKRLPFRGQQPVIASEFSASAETSGCRIAELAASRRLRLSWMLEHAGPVLTSLSAPHPTRRPSSLLQARTVASLLVRNPRAALAMGGGDD